MRVRSAGRMEARKQARQGAWQAVGSRNTAPVVRPAAWGCLAMCAVLPFASPAVGSAQSALRWYPATPVAGSLFRVVIPTAGGALPGTVRVAGEPLHFHVDGDSLVALAAVPVDSGDGIPVEWRLPGGPAESVRIGTRAAEYPLERLTVAPRFGAPPSKAVAERMQRESARAAAVSRASHGTPRLWDSTFVVPRPSRITSPFGGGRTFNGAITSRHMGTDFAGAVGAPVQAANRGVVRLVDRFHLGGNVIYVDHGDGLVTAYLHLSRQLVAEGDTVSRGQVIGHVGATGRVTGPHLHLIARFGGITIDPTSLFGQR